MVTGSDQLAADYEQLKNTLELYPSISITRAEGQPPDHYELEYRLRGYVRNPDGTIEIGDTHRVAINLPFGYPHFPPTVKPLTGIFHPDIDPAAIRIAEQWQNKPSLADLALHIGEMICGSIYNVDDPFNQEAADWYLEHREELPLDVLKIADIEDDGERFDTLDEDTFASLGLEDDDLLGPVADQEDDQAELLLSYLDQKKIYAASGLLQEIPPSVAVPDREKIEERIGRALREADRLYTEAQQLENKGKLKEALATIDRLQDTVADSPGVDELRSRIEQSISFSPAAADEPKPPPLKEKKTEQSRSGQAVAPARPAAADKKVSLPSLPYRAIFIALALIALAGVGGSLYLKDRSALDQAREEWRQTRKLFERRDFSQAEATADTALQALRSVLILRSEKQQLADEINDLLTSRDFQEGLKGNVLYQGEYISEEKAATLQRLAELSGKGEDLIRQGRISKAIAAYEQALRFATDNRLETRAATLRQTINNLRFEQTMISAKRAEQDKEWESAAETYRKALELSRNLADPGEIKEINKRLKAASFRHELDRSKEAFTESQWQQTIEMLEHAQKLIQEDPTAVSSREKEQLARLLASSRLYQTLAKARRAYEQREWDKTIAQYEKALQLLADQRKMFGGDLDDSVAKIEKTLLMVRIAKEQGQAQAAKKNSDLEGVLSHYRTMLTLATGGRFSQDALLRSIAGNIREQIKTTTAQLELEKKIRWLTDNFKEIFRKSYPTYATSKLEKPEVTYLKKENGRMIFNMTCIERSHGRTSRLELTYQYDPASGRWSMYTGQ